MLKAELPSLYQLFFSKELLAVERPEPLATCANCAMTLENQITKCKTRKPEISYQANLKCCTYFPFMPNYLVGAILESEDTAESIRQEIQSRIKKRVYALPIGIVPPIPHQVEFNHRKKNDFGNRADWLCPYYSLSENNCGIWRFRGAVCSTFFCKTIGGKKGQLYWTKLSDYLTYVEAALMEEVLVQLDFSPRQISENLQYLNRFDATAAEKKLHCLPLELAKELWNGYFDQQDWFYRRSFEIVSSLSRKEFKEAMGEQGRALEREVFK